MALSSDSTRRELHELVEQLPAAQVSAALQYMQHLCADPVLLSLLKAPTDHEPYTDEQRAEDAEAAASIARGAGISHEEILREFGP